MRSYSHPEDFALEIGEIVIYSPKSVLSLKRYYFEFDYPQGESEGVFTVWPDVTHESTEELWAENLAVARTLARGSDQ